MARCARHALHRQADSVSEQCFVLLCQCVLCVISCMCCSCVSPPGQGRSVQIRVIVGFVMSPHSDLVWNFLSPTVLTVSPKLLPALGGAHMNISGSDFGLNGTVLVGSRECAVLEWSHEFIRCVSPGGASLAAGVTVTVGLQSNTLSSSISVESVDRVSFEVPIVLSVNVTLLSSTGSEAVQVSGANFGAPLVSVWFTHQPPAILESNPTILLDGASLPCSVLSSSSTKVVCAAPAGGGASWSVVVVNHDVDVRQVDYTSVLVSTNSSAAVRYYAPVILGVCPGASSPKAGFPAVGGFWIRLTGTNFTAQPTVSVTNVDCVVLEANHTSILFVAPPRRVDTDMLVSVQGFEQMSVGVPLVYDPPVIFRILPNVFDAVLSSGRSSLMIIGMNFGPRLSSIAANHVVSVGSELCAFSNWLNDTAMSCSPAGDYIAGAYNVSVAVRGQPSVWTRGRVVWAECQFGFFGPACARCPEGGVCNGRGAEPYALEGYFGGTNNSFARCQPIVACVGGPRNLCSKAYSGDLCGTCSVGYYRCVNSSRV